MALEPESQETGPRVPGVAMELAVTADSDAAAGVDMDAEEEEAAAVGSVGAGSD